MRVGGLTLSSGAPERHFLSGQQHGSVSSARWQRKVYLGPRSPRRRIAVVGNRACATGLSAQGTQFPSDWFYLFYFILRYSECYFFYLTNSKNVECCKYFQNGCLCPSILYLHISKRAPILDQQFYLNVVVMVRRVNVHTYRLCPCIIITSKYLLHINFIYLSYTIVLKTFWFLCLMVNRRSWW